MVMIIFRAKKVLKATIDWKKLLEGVVTAKTLQEAGRKLAFAYRREEQIVLTAEALPKDGLSEEDVADNLALGLELGSYHFEKYECVSPDDCDHLEAAIILVDEPEKVIKQYHYWAAISNALRYSRDLFNEPEDKFPAAELFYELRRLQYLGLVFEQISQQAVSLFWQGEGMANWCLVSKNRKATAVVAGVIKAVALLKLPLKLQAYLMLGDNFEPVNDLLAKNVIYLEEIESEAKAEAEFWRVLTMINEEIYNEKR